MDGIIVQIGHLLLGNGWIDEASLDRALASQAQSGLRLCSLLVSRGLLDVDLASRALGEQRGLPAALQRHIDARDPELARRLPAEIARKHIALPIGETGSGQLIVCVRDPHPKLEAKLVRAVGCDVLMAIYPAQLLEALVLEAYGPRSEFEVDVSTNPTVLPGQDAGIDIGSMGMVELDDVRIPKDLGPSGAPAAAKGPPPIPPARPTPMPPPIPPAIKQSQRLPALHEPKHPPLVKPATMPPPMTATPTQPRPQSPSTPAPARPASTPPRAQSPSTPAPARPASTPPPAAAPPVERSPTMPPATTTRAIRSPTTPPLPAMLPVLLQTEEIEAEQAAATQPPRAKLSLELDPITFEESLAGLDKATTRDEATDIGMLLAKSRWDSALLMAIVEGVAHGYRGHGPQLTPDLVRAINVPLSMDSIIRDAYDLRRLVIDTGDAAVDNRLLRRFGQPTAAIPLIVSGHVTSVLVVGEPIDGGDGPGDLNRLGTALAATYQRLVGDTYRPSL